MRVKFLNNCFKHKGFNYMIICISLLLCSVSCKKLVQVTPPVTTVTGASVFKTDANATSVLTGVYAGMMNTGITNGFVSLSLYPGLSADEFSLYVSSAGYTPYYSNTLTTSANSSTGDIYWNFAYRSLYTINSSIDGISNATELTPSVKKQLLGEAKFMRAFYYFYLTNIYGDVPLVIGTDYSVNSLLPKTAQAQIYQQIIADLNDAKSQLSLNYIDGSLLKISTERVRPTKWAALALLARTYLYKGDWRNAELNADSVINFSTLFNLVPLANTFSKNVSEAIWQLQPVGALNTPDATLFILPSGGPNASFPVYLNKNLIDNFEPGDLRKVNWTRNLVVAGTTYYYPYKYTVNTSTTPVKEYEMVLRLGEQYLIRAEARAQQNNIDGAKRDLDSLRIRAGLPGTIASNQNDILAGIYHERRIELFSEWGHRWFDMKRTATINSIMDTTTIKKGGVWAPFKQWYPIPFIEIITDHNLTQNSGY